MNKLLSLLIAAAFATISVGSFAASHGGAAKMEKKVEAKEEMKDAKKEMKAEKKAAKKAAKKAKKAE